MLEYLLKTTVVWGVCLVFFELFLKKEKYYSWNRTFLLFTLLTGVFMPLLRLGGNENLSTLVLEEPAAQISNFANSLSNVSTLAKQKNENIISIGWSIYFIVLAIALFILIREILLLTALYKRGKKSRIGKYTIIETGIKQSPFSFFNLIFVKAKDSYSPSQWKFILQHEQQHSLLLHSIDKIVLLLLRAGFWFHPLIYVYHKKMMLVHEYQADEAIVENKGDYGRFLIEQAMLNQPSLIAHSFNYSPLKQRIFMLTQKKSPALHLAKYLLALPLMLCLIISCSKSSLSQDRIRKGNKIQFRGNEFEIKTLAPDTVFVEDPVTGELLVKVITRNPIITAVNGKPVHQDQAMFAPIYLGAENSLEQYVFNQLKPELDKLDDGSYNISAFNVVVDEKGKLVYYETSGIQPVQNKQIIKQEIKDRIDKSLFKALNNSMKFKPAVLKGEKVNSIIDLQLSGKHQIVVTDHNASIQ